MWICMCACVCVSVCFGACVNIITLSSIITIRVLFLHVYVGKTRVPVGMPSQERNPNESHSPQDSSRTYATLATPSFPLPFLIKL